MPAIDDADELGLGCGRDAEKPLLLVGRLLARAVTIAILTTAIIGICEALNFQRAFYFWGMWAGTLILDAWRGR